MNETFFMDFFTGLSVHKKHQKGLIHRFCPQTGFFLSAMETTNSQLPISISIIFFYYYYDIFISSKFLVYERGLCECL